MGDLSDGEDAWISAQGVYAKGATGQVGDFLPNGATSIAASYNANISATGGSAAANKVELDTGSWATGIFKAGVQVSVVKDAAVTGVLATQIFMPLGLCQASLQAKLYWT